MAPLVTLHVMHAPRRGPFDKDPSYYLQSAEHVANGDGLVTSVSQYLEGLTPLPQPYHDYPLWPLLLGGVGRIIGMFVAANVLPQLFFVVDLFLFYLLANRLAEGRGTYRIGRDVVDVGHLAVLVLGYNFIFFTSTTDPYTEGLAFALALGSFLLLEERPGWSGLLAGLSVLTRYQMVLVPVTAIFVLLIYRHWSKVGAYFMSCGAVCLSWFVYRQRMEIRRVPIAIWQEWLPQPTFAARLLHVLQGLVVAANPMSSNSLFHSFGIVAAIVPLSFFFVWKEKRVMFWALLLAGIGSMVVLANFESVRPPVWLFGSRHSLPFAFAVVPALVAVVANAPRAIRIAGVLLAVLSIGQGAAAAFWHPLPSGRGLTGADRAMVQWLGKHAPNATLLTSNAQVLSVYSSNQYHWTNCAVDASRTREMLERLSVDYVIVYDAEKRCAFAQGLDDALRLEATFRDEMRRVYLFKVIRKMRSTGAPSRFHTATG